MAGKGIFLVVSRPTSPEDDVEFNRWYNEHHVPDSLLLPGFVRARRFRLAKEQLLPERATAPGFEYVTIYEIDDVDLVPDARALLPRLMGVSAQFFTDALDRDTMRAFVFEQVADIDEPTVLPDGVAALADVPSPSSP
ncbi:hypothetical protein MMAN_21620 [Mycobacterium mantenii]|uniref:EthD domain-containing protein n=2 Tax=Mycobacterium mantenii TaxID=560555 RepID=A0A1X0FM73_MYCNT|nr:hypothetical protein BST30_19230 [Mycobacterium mantenii]BBY38028.1 hypothetical protein MMAN_21620 [Mycobacterium mantenii]